MCRPASPDVSVCVGVCRPASPDVSVCVVQQVLMCHPACLDLSVCVGVCWCVSVCVGVCRRLVQCDRDLRWGLKRIVQPFPRLL